MDTPLGHYSGNALEVDESLSILKGEGPTSTTALCLEFAQRMVKGTHIKIPYLENEILSSLRTGKAFEVFKIEFFCVERNETSIFFIFILLLFLFGYRKQTNYIAKRIECDLKSHD
jgi:thymidine phosphorylase